MDAQWVDQMCSRLIPALAFEITDEDPTNAEQRQARREAYDTVMRLWPVMRAVAQESSPPRYLPPYSDVANGSYRSYLALCVEMHHEIAARADIERYVRPQAPRFAIDALHPWVWDSARPLWDVNRQDALNAAARAVNAQIQRKVQRTDISEVDLTNNLWSEKEPDPKKDEVRLWFTGPHDATWRSRLGGARGLGQACFQGVRNITSHEHELDLSELQAVEYLTMFSTLSRWVEECFVSRGEPLVQKVVVNVNVTPPTLDVSRTIGATAEDARTA